MEGRGWGGEREREICGWVGGWGREREREREREKGLDGWVVERERDRERERWVGERKGWMGGGGGR